ncbi:HET-domain-containing protein [Xylariaceae sp. AK1471]|nr:HET-domain-containing protein [Xylariaceae sp. AK1471]
MIVMAAHQRKPLPHPASQIRLLELQPGKGTIRCHLRITSLDDAHGYEPLSYFWGSQDDPKKIVLDDVVGFPVGRNLYTALKRLRLNDALRTLWVDAICIDQTNIKEKNAQILLMRRIYQHGLRTIVWLGGHDHQTRQAFRAIEELAALYPRGPEDLVFCDRVQETTQPHGPLGSLARFIQRARSQRARLSVLRRQWFSRVWVIQEIAVSNDILVVCGKYSIKWYTIEKAHKVTKDEWDEWGYLRNLLEHRRVFHDSGRLRDIANDNGYIEDDGPQTLEQVLWKSFSSRSTDIRDRVFAVLGLVTSRLEQLEDIKIDYAADPNALFWKVTASCLESADDANLLSIIGCRDPGHVIFCRNDGYATEIELPTWSWIPDFDHSSPVRNLQFSRRKSFKATPVLKAGIRFSDDRTLLRLSGYVVDTIEEVGPVFEEWRDDLGVSLTKWWEQIIRCFLESRKLARVDEEGIYPGTEVSRTEAFHRCLLSIDPTNAKSQLEKNSALAQSKKFERIIVDNFGKSYRDSGLLSAPTWAILAKLAVKYAIGDTELAAVEVLGSWFNLASRRLMKTADGFIGMVPRYTKAGDVVALVKGARVPMVLRAAGERWRFVGESYVEGFMYGEVWNEAKCEVVWVD